MSFFADGCSLDMPRGKSPWGTRYVGKKEVPDGLRRRFEMLPDVRYGDDRHWSTERMGVSQWPLAGTPASAQKVPVRGCDHYEFRDGKVIRTDSYRKTVA